MFHGKIAAADGPAVNSATSKRVLALDLVKIVLATVTIFVHSEIFSHKPELYYFLNSFAFRTTVPFFLILNGYFMFNILDNPERRHAWFKRMAKLYALWFCVYAIFIVIDSHSWQDVLIYALLGPRHLWYITGLIGGGVIMNLIRSWRARYQIALAGAAFLLGYILQFLCTHHVFGLARNDGITDHYFVYRNAFLWCFPVICAGYQIARFRLSARISLPLSVALLALGIGALLVEYALTRHFMTHVGDVKPYDMLLSSPLIAMATFFIFSKVDNAIILKVVPQTIVAYLSGLASIIYFSHIMIMTVLQETLIPYSTFYLCLATIATTYLVSPLIYHLNKRWPIFY